MFIKDIVQGKHLIFEHDSYLFEIVKLLESRVDAKTIPFFTNFKKNELNIIGEIRKFSPDINMLNSSFDINKMTDEFSKCATAISIFTENHVYQGDDSYIEAVNTISSSPILKRDMIVSPLEIFYAKKLGASAITLVSSIFSDIELSEYIRIVKGLKMEPIVEVQNESELRKALSTSANTILISTVSYENFNYDPSILYKLKPLIPICKRCIVECRNYGEDELKILAELKLNNIILSTDIFNNNSILDRANELTEGYKSFL